MAEEKREANEVSGYRIGENLDPPVISFEAPPWCNIDSVYERCRIGILERGLDALFYKMSATGERFRDCEESGVDIGLYFKTHGRYVDSIRSTLETMPPYFSGMQKCLCNLLDLNALTRYVNLHTYETPYRVITCNTLMAFLVDAYVMGCRDFDQLHSLLTDLRCAGILAPIHKQIIIYIDQNAETAYRSYTNYNFKGDRVRNFKNYSDAYKKILSYTYDKIITIQYDHDLGYAQGEALRIIEASLKGEKNYALLRSRSAPAKSGNKRIISTASRMWVSARKELTKKRPRKR